MTPALVVLGVVVLLALSVVVSYNRFVRQRNLVQESWKQVDVELTRRHDLVPNLVETVKGYAAHERTVLVSVVEARTAALAPQPSLSAFGEAETRLVDALRGLLVVAESYPELQASSSFLQLQNQLSETEDRIAAARRFYNGNVRALNTRVDAFPSSLVASAFRFAREEYFEAEEAAISAPVRVDFTV